MPSTKRLYIFTGKGGVGKTTLSLSFTKYLQEQNKKVLFVYFKNNKLGEEALSFDEANDLALPLEINTKGLELLNSAKGYIGKKLKSETIAKWIIKTPFFTSLVNMIPGFNYLIYMGQILELLDKDPDLTIVLDSPSSGHALTMLESTQNFNNIFQSGLIHNDTQKMLNLMNQDNFLAVNIISLPTLLAIHEGQELLKSIKDIGNYRSQIYCNNSLTMAADPSTETLPQFLREKLTNEQEALNTHSKDISYKIPYILDDRPLQLVKALVPLMQNLV